MFPKSTHETFSTKLFQHFRSHPRLGKEKFSQTDFTVSHYAGKVSTSYWTFSRFRHMLWHITMFKEIFHCFYVGHVSYRYLFRQKSWLCYSRTLQSIIFFKMPFCFWSISFAIWRIFKIIIQVFFSSCQI